MNRADTVVQPRGRGSVRATFNYSNVAPSSACVQRSFYSFIFI